MTLHHLQKTKHDNKPFVELLVMIATRGMIETNDKEDKDVVEKEKINSIDQTNT